MRVRATMLKGLSLSTLAPGGPQGNILQDVTGRILWDTLLLHLEVSKAKQTDQNMRINYPILFLIPPAEIGLLLAAAPWLAWA